MASGGISSGITKPEVMIHREILERLIMNNGFVITDTGYDFKSEQGEVVYVSSNGSRFEVTVRRLDD